jgi:hypothetical protein
MGSPIVDIQTRTGSKSNLPLFGAERKEIQQRVKAALQRPAAPGQTRPANIAQLMKELGMSSKPSTTYRNLGVGKREGL